MNTTTRQIGEQTRAAPRARRGFALILVIVLAMVGGMAIVILLQRTSVEHLAANRQTKSYADHHRGKGMQEMISRWLNTARGRLLDVVDDDGLAFTMRMPHEGEV